MSTTGLIFALQQVPVGCTVPGQANKLLTISAYLDTEELLSRLVRKLPVPVHFHIALLRKRFQGSL
jgi:hypothetical protein